jgi:tetratricopeptide (TPR) repeat protein
MAQIRMFLTGCDGAIGQGQADTLHCFSGPPRRKRTCPIMRSLWIAIATLSLVVSATPTSRATKPPATDAPVQPPPKITRHAPSTPSAEQPLQRHLRAARTLFAHEQDCKTAAEHYRKALRLDRGCTQAHTGLVACALREKRWKKAVQTATQWTRIAPRQARAWVLLGEAHRLSGATGKAHKAFERAIEINPQEPNALLRTGDLLSAQYLASPSPPLRARMMDRYTRFLRVSKARHGLDVKRVEPIVAGLRHGPAGVAFLQGREQFHAAFRHWRQLTMMLSKAHHTLQGVLAHRPSHAAAHYFKGLIHLNIKSQQHHSVFQALEEFKSAGPYPPALIALGRYWREQDELDKATASLQRAVQIDPKRHEGWCELGMAQIRAGRRREAQESFERCVDLDPSSYWGPKAQRALNRLDPTHPRRLHGAGFQPWPKAIIQAEPYNQARTALERRMGGVDTESPHLKILTTILKRLLKVADYPNVSPRPFQAVVTRSQLATSLAIPSGQIYVTRGTLDFIEHHFPERPMDEHNGLIAADIARQIAHILLGHFEPADSLRPASTDAILETHALMPSVGLPVFEADREGMRLMLLAGYDPYDSIELLERRLQQSGDIPAGMGIATLDRRIHYLREYWSDELAVPFTSLHQGLAYIDDALRIERMDLNGAASRYRSAIAGIRHFTVAFKRTQQTLRGLGLAYTKLGLFEISKYPAQCGVCSWHSAFSVEPELALKYVSLRPASRHRKHKPGEPRLPVALRTAKTYLRDALRSDANDHQARLTWVYVQLAMGNWGEATKALRTLQSDCETAPECGVSMQQVDNLQGIVLAEEGRLPEAIAAFESSLKVSGAPDTSPPSRYNLARALELASRTDDAILAYEIFLEMSGEDEDTYWTKQASTALERLGK